MKSCLVSSLRTNKKMALMGAAALAPALSWAQSNVILYGAVSQDIVSATHVYRNGSEGKFTGLEGGVISPSRFGVKGTEDLGGGLKATFNLEAGFAPDTGQSFNPYWNRNSTVGLMGSLGTVTIGRQFNINDDVMGNYFLYGGYSVFRYTEFGGLSDILNNSFKYYTPLLGKFQLGLMYSIGEQTQSNSRGNTFETSLKYADGGFSTAVTYREQKRFTEPFIDKLAAAGLAYRIGDFRGRIAYSESRSDAPTFVTTAAADIGFDYFVWQDQLRLTADYVSRNVKGSGNDSHFVRLLADYSLSKRTALTAQYLRMSNKGTAAERFFGDGAPGVSQSAFLIGMRHNF